MREGDTPYRYLGYAAQGIGDVNGDGYDDIAMRGRLAELPDTRSWFCTARPTARSRRPGRLPSTAAMGGAGDVNGDGFDDLLIGDPDYRSTNPAAPGTGRALLFLGSADGLSPVADWTLESADPNERLRRASPMPATSTSDGYDDVLVSGTMRLPDRLRLASLARPRAWSRQPHWMACYFGSRRRHALGDVNGDGFDDISVGRSGTSQTSGLPRHRGRPARDAPAQPPDQPAAHHRRRPERLGGRRPASRSTAARPRRASARRPRPGCAATVRTNWDLGQPLPGRSRGRRRDRQRQRRRLARRRDRAGLLRALRRQPGRRRHAPIHDQRRRPRYRLRQPSPPIEAATRVVPGGWDAEVRIPTRTFMAAPQPAAGVPSPSTWACTTTTMAATGTAT